jgi:hypothetical protein
MKLMTSILAVAIMTAAVWAQSPNTIDSARSTPQSLQQTKTNVTIAALAAPGVPAQAAKPAPGAPSPAVKPATIPGAKPVASAPASSESNRLERVNVVRNADDIQIEISSREAVTPKVSKLSSPARLVVELPATTMATPQSKIPVGSAGVKGVRIGMDGKTPPTTSVVVDLEQACNYDMAPGPGNTMVLTLHTQALAKSTPAAVPAKTSAPAAKLQTVAAKPVVAPPAAVPAAKSNPAPVAATVKPHDAFMPKNSAGTPPAAKVAAPKTAIQPANTITTKIAADEKGAGASAMGEAPKPKADEKKWAMNGKRDPFFSPVVQQASGSGCSTGKKCLEIGQINLRGVVKAESGFIAVVTNSLNKAYFLHENDPVFNGYVVKITGDSVVFQETVQDKLGKSLTREVVKRIFTPAV